MRRPSILCVVALAGCVAGAAPRVEAFTTVLSNPSPDPGDLFGWTIAAVGANLAVGAPRDDAGGNASGVVHLFTPAGALLRTVPNPEPADFATFGWTVAGLGEQLLVGVTGFNEPTGLFCAVDPENCGAAAGAVYLFDPATGAVLHRFANPTPGRADQFGMAIAVVGGDVLIGAPFDNNGGVKDAGAAYLFHNDGEDWVLRQAFFSPSPKAGEQFGMAVAALGGDVVIGAPHARVQTIGGETPSTATGPGTVFRFHFDGSGWVPTTYPNPNGAAGKADAFGQAVATPGGQLLVGAPHEGAGDAGAAYLIAAVGGAVLQTFRKPGVAAVSEQFGYTVAALGEDALIGAWYDTTGGLDAGAVYVFRSANGERARTYVGGPGDEFGGSLAALGDRIAIGAGKDGDVGAVSIFDAPRCGDGVKDGDEQCDDGDLERPDDCCTAVCQSKFRTSRCGDQTSGPCDEVDRCDAFGTCQPNHLPAGTACPDDGAECTLDQCGADGACTHPPQPTRFPCPDDGNVCTADVCDGLGACSHPGTEMNGTLCDTGDSVCLGDTCQEGVCRDYLVCRSFVDVGTKAAQLGERPIVELTCASGTPGKGKFCEVEGEVEDDVAAPAVLRPLAAGTAPQPVIRKKRFKLNPKTGSKVQKLKLTKVGRQLLATAAGAGRSLTVTLKVTIEVAKQRTPLQLLVQLRKSVR